jgi:hypothetical protein
MDYKILPYSYAQAKLLGLEIKPSSKKGKKIDVYKDNNLLASVGGKGYKDYPTYIEENGKVYADERRRLYKIRHQKDRTKVGSNGWFADKILW